MRQEHPHWPPTEGTLWVAVADWNWGAPAVRRGDLVMVLKELPAPEVGDHVLTVMAHGATRTIIAEEGDLNPLVWHLDAV